MSSLFKQQLQFIQNNQIYRGRFAPSPSGPLHFGSLIAAVASYLQAKSQQGLWFVRMEDIDQPRCIKGSDLEILSALDAFGLHWDIDPNTENDLRTADQGCLYQSQRLERYQLVLQQLQQQQLVYGCECTRKEIRLAGNEYLGTCRNKGLTLDERAIRLKANQSINDFNELILTDFKNDQLNCNEDYIIKRKDGLFAYQLVVVIDDIDQGITEVVRGADIMPLTLRQVNLFHLLGMPAPSFAHIPLISASQGFKLSKQNKAKAINIDNPKPELIEALTLLGLPTSEHNDLASGSVTQILSWAIENWHLNKVPKQTEILRPQG